MRLQHTTLLAPVRCMRWIDRSLCSNSIHGQQQQKSKGRPKCTPSSCASNRSSNNSKRGSSRLLNLPNFLRRWRSRVHQRLTTKHNISALALLVIVALAASVWTQDSTIALDWTRAHSGTPETGLLLRESPRLMPCNAVDCELWDLNRIKPF